MRVAWICDPDRRPLTSKAWPLATLQGFDARISDDVFEVLTLRGSLNARNVLGGTAPAQARAQIARHQQRLG